MNLLGLTNTEVAEKDYHVYVDKLKSRLTRSYELASSKSKMSQSRQKKNYDKHVRGAVVQAGDCVLVKVVAWDGKHKIADRWEDEPYAVLEQPNPDIPVYVVCREDKVGPKRTLHRNLLLPIGQLPRSLPSIKRGHAVDAHSSDQSNPDADANSSAESSDEECSNEDGFDVIETIEQPVDTHNQVDAHVDYNVVTPDVLAPDPATEPVIPVIEDPDVNSLDSDTSDVEVQEVEIQPLAETRAPEVQRPVPAQRRSSRNKRPWGSNMAELWRLCHVSSHSH